MTPYKTKLRGGGGWKYQSLDYRVLITVKRFFYKTIAEQ